MSKMDGRQSGRADVTLRDVAADCGLDVSTISRALNGDPRVATATIATVKESATRLGYRPNLAARALRAGATRTMWLLVGSLESEFERRMVAATSLAVEQAGYNLLIACYREDPAVFDRLIGRLDLGLADAALVIAPSSDTIPPCAALEALLARRWPLVFLDRSMGLADMPTVTSDNAEATRLLVRRLAQAGATRLAVCSTERNEVAVIRRRTALEEAAVLGLAASDRPDAGWLGREPGTLAVFGNTQDQVLGFCARSSANLKDTPLLFAVFDRWAGEPHPARLALVAEQDCETLTRSAVARLLEMISSPTDCQAGCDRMPIKAISEIGARFAGE